MVNYQEMRVHLTDTQLNKLKFATKNKRVTFPNDTPKIHKPFLSTFFLHISSNYATKESLYFIGEIKQLNTYCKFIISFDFTSLFTNISLEKTINIATDTIFEIYPNVNFTRKELQNLFKIATSETQFIFNHEINDQIDGVSTGSPLSPILANLFMGYHKKD